MKSKIVFAAILLFIGMNGCGPKSEIIGLWEYHDGGLETPDIAIQHHRFRFRKDQTAIRESKDGSYSISAWRWGKFHGESSDLPLYVQMAQTKGYQVYTNQILLVFQGGKYEWGFAHEYSFYTSYSYFNQRNQLVLYDPIDEMAFVYNRMD